MYFLTFQKYLNKMTKKKAPIQKKTIEKSNPDLIKSANTVVKSDISKGKPSIRQIVSLLTLAICLIAYLLIWKNPEIVVKDPWYLSAIKLDSANKIQDSSLKSKLLSEAGSELKALIDRYPNHARVHFFLALYYYNTQQWDSAMAHNKICMHLDSGSTINSIWPNAKQNLSAIYLNKTNNCLRSNDLNTAVKLLQEGIFQNPAESAFFTIMGNIMLHYSKADSALFYYNKSIERNPSNTDVLNNIGVIYQRTGNPEEAAKYFKKALAVNPKNSEAAKNLQNVQNLIKK